MNTLFVRRTFFQIGAGLACALLAGCAAFHAQPRPVAVSSPPPPPFGTGPLVAHDEYAQYLVPSPGRLRHVVAQAGNAHP